MNPLLPITLLAAPLALHVLQDEPPLQAVTVLARERSDVLDRAFVETDHLWLPASHLRRINGFALKPEGLCAGEICIPLPAGSVWTKIRDGETFVDATAFAAHVRQASARSRDGSVWSFAPVPLLASPLLVGQAPDFELLDREDNAVRLSDFRGSKVLLLTWASW